MFSALRFGVVRKPVLEQVEKDFVNRLVQNFVMNVTALNNYLECPLKFYYTTLLRVPSAKSEAMEYGSAVHDALNDFMKKMMDNKKLYPSKSYLLQRFDFYLNKRREVFTQVSLARFSEYGERIMGKYYDSRFKEGAPGDYVITEYAAGATVLNDIPLKGFIDKIQFINDDIIVTDYKTSTKAKAKKSLSFSRPEEDEKKPAGGNYWRQAAFYKLLIDHLPTKNWNVLYSQFDFLDPNEKEDFDLVRVDIGAEDVEAVSRQIEDVWQKIQAHDFYTGCGNEKCEWCNFTRNNKLYARLEEAEQVTEE
jgi:DNA helicase-2/ATP-dependent DNA helicase PcrA